MRRLYRRERLNWGVAFRRNTALAVEQFFQIALLGLLCSASGALMTTHRLDALTISVIAGGLGLRALVLTGHLSIVPGGRTISLIAVATVALWAVDNFFLSRSFFLATVHSAAILATVRIVTARSNRTYAFSGFLAFGAMAGAAVLADGAGYFFWLALFLLLTVAVLASGEIRRGFQRNEFVVAPLQAQVTRRLAWVTVAATGGLLAIALGLFLLVPRTARAAAGFFPHAARLSGFSTSIDLGRFGAIGKDNRPVMHIRSYSGPLPAGLLWRGTALTDFDGKHWTQMAVPVMEVTPRRTVVVADRLQRSRLDSNRMLYRVDVNTSDSGILFIAGVPEFINIDTPRLRRLWEDTYRALPVEGQPLRYEISAWAGTPLTYPMRDEERRRDLRLPPIDPRVWHLALQWAGEGTAAEKVSRIEQHLKQEYKYSLQTTDHPPPDPVADFLFHTKQGYCEYFASAMTVMVRSLGIPARVATGFAGGYWNPLSGLYVVRGADAHAWVEAWIDGAGWRTWDPTPPAPAEAENALLSGLGVWLDAADSMWQQWVVTYDLGRQAELVVSFANRLRVWSNPETGFVSAWRKAVRNWSAPQLAGWVLAFAGLALLGLFGAVPLWRWSQRRWLILRNRQAGRTRQDATELYIALLDRLAARGFTRSDSTTPMEFARHLPPEHAATVTRFTQVYNSVRFGGETAATAELAGLLAAFDA